MSADEGWQEAGGKTAKSADVEVADIQVISVNPNNDPRYVEVVTKLRTWHGELLRLNITDNPALIGEYLGKLRLNVNLLFSFLNAYIDALTDSETELAVKQQNLYEEILKQPKSSENKAKIHSSELTRIDRANINVLENRITQIKNEYERYNGICMFLQSRMKEFNTERIMG